MNRLESDSDYEVEHESENDEEITKKVNEGEVARGDESEDDSNPENDQEGSDIECEKEEEEKKSDDDSEAFIDSDELESSIDCERERKEKKEKKKIEYINESSELEEYTDSSGADSDSEKGEKEREREGNDYANGKNKEHNNEIDEPTKVPKKWTEITDPDNYTSYLNLENMEDKRFIDSNVIRDDMDPYQIFCLFFTDDLFFYMTEQTNAYYDHFCKKHESYLTACPNSRYTRHQKVTVSEMRIFIGIRLFMGVHTVTDIRDHWCTDELLNTNIGRFMSKDRYFGISRFFHVCDNANRTVSNRLYKIQYIMDFLIKKYQFYYYPGRDVSIDETMIPFNGRLSFKSYLKDKPTRYGIKMYVLADSENAYVLRGLIYHGKVEHEANQGATNTLVKELMEGYLDNHHRLFMDNFYTTVDLMKDLYERRTGCIGTMRMNRAHEVGLDKGLKKYESRFFHNAYRKEIMLTFWWDTKMVRGLSNCSPPEVIIHKKTNKDMYFREKSMPTLFRDYNQKARGVDRANQLVCYFKYPHRCMKWWHAVFHHFLQVTLSNSFILYKNTRDPSTKKKLTHKDFVLSVLKSLLYCDGEPKTRTNIKFREEQKQQEQIVNKRRNDRMSKKQREEKEQKEAVAGNQSMINTNLGNFHFCGKLTMEQRDVKYKCHNPGCKKTALFYCKRCTSNDPLKQYVALCVPKCFAQYHVKRFNLKPDDNFKVYNDSVERGVKPDINMANINPTHKIKFNDFPPTHDVKREHNNKPIQAPKTISKRKPRIDLNQSNGTIDKMMFKEDKSSINDQSFNNINDRSMISNEFDSKFQNSQNNSNMDITIDNMSMNAMDIDQNEENYVNPRANISLPNIISETPTQMTHMTHMTHNTHNTQLKSEYGDDNEKTSDFLTRMNGGNIINPGNTRRNLTINPLKNVVDMDIDNSDDEF